MKKTLKAAAAHGPLKERDAIGRQSQKCGCPHSKTTWRERESERTVYEPVTGYEPERQQVTNPHLKATCTLSRQRESLLTTY